MCLLQGIGPNGAYDPIAGIKIKRKKTGVIFSWKPRIFIKSEYEYITSPGLDKLYNF